MKENANGNKFTTLKIFIPAITLVFILMFVIGNFLWRRIELLEVAIDSSDKEIHKIGKNVASIRTDVSWIKNTLEDL